MSFEGIERLIYGLHGAERVVGPIALPRDAMCTAKGWSMNEVMFVFFFASEFSSEWILIYILIARQ